MTKKENFRRKQYFSIRKYKMGACSVLLGTSLFLSLSYTGEAKAIEEKEVCIHAVDNSSLSEQIKSQLKVFEENKITVEEGKSYYFVYKKNNVLPSTGGVTSGTAVLGGALLLVCLTLIKKKKGKLIFLVSMLTVSGNLSQVMAFEDFKEIQPVVIKTSIGGMLPSPEEIPGYSFTGYYFETGNTCTNKSSSIKIEERGGFTPGLVEEKVAVSEKGEPLVQPENPVGVVSEKGEPLVQSENPEGVVSEKGEPLVQSENLVGVVSEKGEPLVQSENPVGVVSEKGEPLVQPEKPLASWNGPTLVREENPIAYVSIKGDSLVQPENPEYEIKPTPEQPTPEVTPKPVRPAEEPKSKISIPDKVDIDDTDEPVPLVRPNRPCEIKVIPEHLASDEKLNPFVYKTIYEPDPYLKYKEQQEERSCENTIISYTRDESTGKIAEKIKKYPGDRFILVGNVEKIVKPIEITEEREEDPELPKGMELVREGVRGKITITRTYEVNSETGELTNPKEETKITRLMIPKVTFVGTKEDKPHLLPVNSVLENAVNVIEATAAMRNVDLLTNEKLKAQLTPSDIEINRDLFLKRKELQKTNPTITDEEVKEVLRKEYLEKLSIKETLEETKTDLDARLKKVAAHTLSIIGDTPQNREKVKRDIEANKEKILLGLSYINRFYNIDFGDTNIRDILAYNPSSFGKKNVTSLD